MAVPAPTFCPDCRLQRRLAWRNDRALYKRKCSLCKKDILAMYPEGTAFPVYCRSCFRSDKWDTLSYGQEYDFSRPFFTQFKELQAKVPRIALQVGSSPSSEYVNQVLNCKNCYLVNSGNDNEDCRYSFRISQSKDSSDCFAVSQCEECYWAISSLHLSSSRFCDTSFDSFNLSFCFDVTGSQDSFLAVGKRHVSYVIRNRQYTKEAYLAQMKNIDFGSRKYIAAYKKELEELKLRSPQKYAQIKHAVNVTGNHIVNSKNCREVWYASDLENCSYSIFLKEAKDSMDINNGCCTMWSNYEVCTMGVSAYNIMFSVDAWPEAYNQSYCDSCHDNAGNLFGCIGVRHKQYCILNKAYDKKSFETLKAKIIEHMDKMPYEDKKGRKYRYGEFFPAELSPFSYNEATAQEWFPLSDQSAAKEGYLWRKVETKHYTITKEGASLPDHIKDVPDDIIKETVGCAHEGKCHEQCTIAFRIIPAELAFYRKMNVPLPIFCPNCRHYERLLAQNPRKLWKRICMCKGSEDHLHGANACPNEFQTSYGPERKEIIFCEPCYQAEIV